MSLAPGKRIAPPAASTNGATKTEPRRTNLSALLSAVGQKKGDSVALIGPEKTGKTSAFAFGSPRPFFLFADRMGDAVLPQSFRDKVFPDAWDDLPGKPVACSIMGTLRALCDEEHDYQTVIIDHMGLAQALLWQWVCDKHDVKSIKEVDSWGGGYTAALEQVNKMLGLLFRLAEKGVNWIIISHQEAKAGNDPTGAEYEKWIPALHQKSAGAILGAVNTILFAEPVVATVKVGKPDRNGIQKQRGARTGVTKAVVRPKQGIQAGSRWLLPPDFLLSWAVYEQEKTKGEALREALYRHLSILIPEQRAEADTYLATYGWSRDAVEQVIAAAGGEIKALPEDEIPETNTDTETKGQE